MDIFILNLDTFPCEKLLSFKDNFSDNVKYGNILKKKQHLAGLYLFEHVTSNFYNIENARMEIINNKPFMKNSDLYFSISHSRNIVVIGFEKSLIGIDVEYNKKTRNFYDIAKRCFTDEESQQIQNLKGAEQQKYFYELWTQYEAKIKSGIREKTVYCNTAYFIDDFTFSAVSEVQTDINQIKLVKPKFF